MVRVVKDSQVVGDIAVPDVGIIRDDNQIDGVSKRKLLCEHRGKGSLGMDGKS